MSSALTALTPERDRGTPLYLQLARKIRDYIESGAVESGDALPSERELSELTGTSRVTIRKALEQLIEEGLLARKKGSGTFVMPRIEQPGTSLSGFSDDARHRGKRPGSVWLVRDFGSPTEEEASILAIPVTAKVARLGRIRFADDEPLAIEHAVLPAVLLPIALDQIGASLYETLEELGHRPVRGTQRIRASLANPTEAGLLSVNESSEILRIERRTFLADGRPVELTRSAYRGDRYDFMTELNTMGPSG